MQIDRRHFLGRAAASGALGALDVRSLAAGLTFRPFAQTARETLAWFQALPLERQTKLRAGLSPEREAEVLQAWHEQANLDP